MPREQHHKPDEEGQAGQPGGEGPDATADTGEQPPPPPPAEDDGPGGGGIPDTQKPKP